MPVDLPPTRRFLPLLLAAALAWSCGPQHAAAPRPVELTILATTDFHGALETGGKETGTGRPLGGAAALAAVIARERRAAGPGAILVDAGDMFQGTALSNLTEGRATMDFMNLVGFDAAAVGNHEFDWGVTVLARRIAQAEFPLLIANLVEKQSGRAPPWARPYAILERRGLRVAVIGLTTRETPLVTLPSNVEPYEFLPPAEVASRLVAELVPARADLAVLVCHVGLWPPESAEEGAVPAGELAELARAVPGAAAIAGGHTHLGFAGAIAGIPVVEAASNGRYLGRIRLRLDRASRRTLEAAADLVPVHADEVTPDARVAALVERAGQEVAPLLAEVLGEAAVTLEAAYRESAMGNLVADVLRARAGADLAFQNPGGVRASLDAGPITYQDVYEVAPFDNTLVVVRLTGAEVRQLLEQGAETAGFLLVSGLRYALDPGKPAGSRVTLLTPLDEGRTYRVAINDFMAQGGDGLALLERRPEAEDTGILLRDVLADWIRRETRAGRKVVAPEPGRIVQEQTAGSGR